MFQFIGAIVAIVVIGAVFSRCFVEIVPEGQTAVLVRLGRVRRTLGPGPKLVVPGIEELLLVSLAPQHLDVRVAGHTSDGAAVQVRTAVVYRIVEPLLALRNGRSLGTQVGDGVRAGAAQAISGFTLEQLHRKQGEVADSVALQASDAVESIGVTLQSLRITALAFTPVVADAVGRAVVAQLHGEAALIDARVRATVSEIDGRARVAALRSLDAVARRAHANTLELERITALQHVLANDRATVVTGLHDTAWALLPAPQAVDRLG